MTASEMAELDRRIAVMQAYRDGKTIEAVCRDASMPWVTMTVQPAWAWNVADYRIAPRKPREFWLCPGREMQTILRAYSCQQMSHTTGNPLPGQIYVREVLPDDYMVDTSRLR
jgi:hypothetical protein